MISFKKTTISFASLILIMLSSVLNAQAPVIDSKNKLKISPQIKTIKNCPTCANTEDDIFGTNTSNPLNITITPTVSTGKMAPTTGASSSNLSKAICLSPKRYYDTVDGVCLTLEEVVSKNKS